MIACAVGHSPDKLGGMDYDRVERLLAQWLPLLDVDYIITGNWAGIDRLLGAAARRLEIPFMCVEAYVWNEQAAPKEEREIFNRNCIHGSYFRLSQGGRTPEAVTAGNRYRINHSDIVLTLWCGSAGGTADARAYAQAQGKTVIDLWTEFYG